MSSKNNVRKEMLRLANSVAKMEFSQEILRDEKIRKIISDHPEFDSGEFKKMVRDFQSKLRTREIQENESTS